MTRKNTNVIFVAEALLRRNIYLITTMFILEKNLTSVSFAQLVLPAKELMQHINEVILVIVAIIPRSKAQCAQVESNESEKQIAGTFEG